MQNGVQGPVSEMLPDPGDNLFEIDDETFQGKWAASAWRTGSLLASKSRAW